MRSSALPGTMLGNGPQAPFINGSFSTRRLGISIRPAAVPCIVTAICLGAKRPAVLGMKVVEHPPLIAALHGQLLRRRAMDLKLKDKVALITGSSRGIGLATAKAFAAEGCCLVLSARSAEPLAAAEAALRADGVVVASCLADVGQPDQAARLVEAAVAAFGGID